MCGACGAPHWPARRLEALHAAPMALYAGVEHLAAVALPPVA
jgi:hypothetical protein